MHDLAEQGAPARAAAARAIAAVWAGRSLDAALAEIRPQLSAADQGLAAAIAYGVIRENRLLAALAQPLFRRRPKKIIHALILAGLFQLRSMRVPAHAALHATVGAAPLLGQSRARGLVNAVLRRFQREQEPIEAQVPDVIGVRSSHPDWLVTRLQQDWPHAWQALLRANNVAAPMTLRVNRRRTTREEYLRALAAAGIPAHPHAHAGDAVTLVEPTAVEALPGFADGWASVQDAAAQLATPLLGLKDGMRVLDACAAPGGKTGHCLEQADCDMHALDNDVERLRAVADNLQRLQLPAPVSAQRDEANEASGVLLRPVDAAQPDDWWDGRAFERILLDAPCTGTGVIRRHPDIKWLRRQADVAALAARQRALLAGLWPLLAPGGVLVYATCSVLRAEGAAVAAEFLHHTPTARELPIAAAWGSAEAVGRRVAPGVDGMDGFYYARFCKDS